MLITLSFLIFFSKNSISINIVTLKKCMQVLHDWFTINGLVLNPNKSEVIILRTGSCLKSRDAIDKILVANASIQPAACLKSLAVIVDLILMDKHVNSICRSINYNILALRIFALLIQLMLQTKLCVPLLVYEWISVIGCFTEHQRQATAPTELNYTRCERHVQICITSVLRRLHWLRMQSRISYN